MFTGIVQAVAPIVAIEEKTNFRTHIVRFPPALLPGLAIGASVANNGCCLTITAINSDLVSFDMMNETLRLTNLGQLKVGDKVNLERAAKFGDEVGGHIMSGHILCTAEISRIICSENNRQVWFTLPESYMKYILYKGFIGIDGISLTISDKDPTQFSVNLIPETLNKTLMGERQLHQLVNIEVDPQTQAIVDTVERVLQQHQLS